MFLSSSGMCRLIRLEVLSILLKMKWIRFQTPNPTGIEKFIIRAGKEIDNDRGSGKFKEHKIRWEYSNLNEYNKYTR